MDAVQANDGVVRLKPLSCKENCRTKSLDMVWEMKQNMELALVEPLCVPQRSGSKQIINSILKILLEGLYEYKHNRQQHRSHLTRYLSRSSISD
jgi:hypothetical protein